jgi:peptide/nickel transport system substrate-binding protein
MMEGYWRENLKQRLARRRLLSASALAITGAVLSTACSGGSDANGDKSGLLAKPADTSKQAKRGGVLKRSAPTDVDTFYAYQSGMTNVGYFEMVYSRPFGLKPGRLEPSQDEIEPDVCESWEWSPDRLTLTARLRPAVKFHNLPPVNARAMDMDDVLTSWKLFSTVGSNRSIVVNSVNPQAPVLAVAAADSKTLVIKFKEPIVYLQSYLASRAYWNIVPKEAENPQVLDLRSRMMGTGPFLLSEHRPSVGLTYKRHAEYWEKEVPYVDQIEYPIVPEYASAMAQFRGGSIYTYAVRQEDILGTKREVPQLNLYQNDVGSDGTRMFWGWQAAPVRDKRVRQAFSMSIARDEWITAQYNTDTFESQGLPVEKRWNTSLQCLDSLAGWWLDPKGKDFGTNAKFYEHNVAEARKLLAAAGYSSGGPEIQSNHFTTGEYGPDFPRNVELWEGMASEAGFRFKKNIIQREEFNRVFRDSSGNFAGISYKTGPPAPTNDAVDRLTFEFAKRGGIGFHGFDAAAKGDGSGDPYLETELAKASVEVDTNKRRSIVHDVQRYLAEQQYCIRWPGGATSFALAWPAIRNYRVFYPGTALGTKTENMSWWIDETSAPLKKA